MTNKMVLNSNFVELNDDEAMQIDGGIGWGAVALIVVGGLFLAGSLKGCSDADQGK